MRLSLFIERVSPEADYTAICYKVTDDLGEVIYRTANRARADELVSTFNGSHDAANRAASASNRIRRLEEAAERAKARQRKLVEALRDVAKCPVSSVCGKCPNWATCKVSCYVSSARTTLAEMGLKVEKKPNAAKK